MVTASMPQDIPPCGRIGCTLKLDKPHRHEDWEPGDRVVVEPKLTTAPGWAYNNPRGTVVVGPHARVTTAVVTIALDSGGVPVEVDAHLLTRQRTYDQRMGRQAKRKPREPKVPKKAILSDRYDEPTLGDWLAEEMDAAS